MAWSISDLFPPWGDGGEIPPDNFQYDGGDQVNEKHLDYLWDKVGGLEDEVRSALTDIDSDKDGSVDNADNADEYANTAPADGNANQFLQTDGTTTQWATALGAEINADATGSATTGDFSYFTLIGLDDGDRVEFDVASFVDSETGVNPAPSGIDLVLAAEGDKKVTILAGDGTTVYDSEQLNVSYENTTGNEETLAIGFDNGEFNSGAGDIVTATAYVRGKIL
jgi:hypothetical protein